MGLLDKAKFWKKGEEDFGDLGDLGEFGLEDKPSATGAEPAPDLPGMGPLPDLQEQVKPGMQVGVPTHMEDAQPTQASREIGDQLGLTPAQPVAHPVQPAAAPPMQPAPASPGHGMAELSKDIEIIHAKLDAIKSSLDSINQRLATLERMASPDTTKNRYTW